MRSAGYYSTAQYTYNCRLLRVVGRRRGSRVKVFLRGYWGLGRYVRGSEATEQGEGVGGGVSPLPR